MYRNSSVSAGIAAISTTIWPSSTPTLTR
jgi:hypothetical protein